MNTFPHRPIEANVGRDALRADGYPTPGQMHSASSMLLGAQSVQTIPPSHHYHHHFASNASSMASAFASGPFGAPNGFTIGPHHQPPTDSHHDFLLRTSVSHW